MGASPACRQRAAEALRSPRMEAPPRAAPRSLVPREHGAWGQLGVPLLTALLLARPTFAALAWACASVVVFLAHEPFLVALGHRGPRALREDGARARRRLLLLCASGAILGIAGLALAPPLARTAVALPLALGAAVTAFIHRDAERSIAGETVAAAALASTGVPVALCEGVSRASALGTWAAWVVGFALVTPAVRAVIVHARTPTPRTRRLPYRRFLPERRQRRCRLCTHPDCQRPDHHQVGIRSARSG